ncbi:BMP family ABC transporter substrate-binding protein [Pacificispira sp.]|uniref:BMP family ABC transporter substrate-binding protein n=1 Tax=Pacificispira sp. TaxID=2888761 RepID=UPI003BAC387C
MIKLTRRSFSAMTLAAGAAAALPARAADPFKVGFVYVGPIGDHGWSYQHDQGRLAIEAEFGDKVETSYVESVPEGADAERVITQLARSGHKLIFTTSFGYMNPTAKVAKNFPDVMFEHATGFTRASNLATYAARFYEGRYVAGILAGHVSKTNKVGYIASIPIPEVIRGINAFTLSARKINPAIEVTPIWVNSWYDPGKEADSAKALIDQGADIILQHTDSPAPVQTAEERGVWSVGQASDMAKFGPKSHMTAIIDDWAPYYVERTRQAMAGSWTSGDIWGGFDTGMVKMGEYNSALPEAAVAEAKAAHDAISAGTLHPFTGPIKNQAGETVVADGATLDDGELLGMNWYVEGVNGKVPS